MFIEPGKLKGKAIELSVPLCLVNKHTPDRKAALWDGAWGETAEWARDPDGTRFAGPPPSTQWATGDR